MSAETQGAETRTGEAPMSAEERRDAFYSAVEADTLYIVQKRLNEATELLHEIRAAAGLPWDATFDQIRPAVKALRRERDEARKWARLWKVTATRERRWSERVEERYHRAADVLFAIGRWAREGSCLPAVATPLDELEKRATDACERLAARATPAGGTEP